MGPNGGSSAQSTVHMELGLRLILLHNVLYVSQSNN
jgi:hypothetical protein